MTSAKDDDPNHPPHTIYLVRPVLEERNGCWVAVRDDNGDVKTRSFKIESSDYEQHATEEPPPEDLAALLRSGAPIGHEGNDGPALFCGTFLVNLAALRYADGSGRDE